MSSKSCHLQSSVLTAHLRCVLQALCLIYARHVTFLISSNAVKDQLSLFSISPAPYFPPLICRLIFKVHCTMYCPISSLSSLSFISPICITYKLLFNACLFLIQFSLYSSFYSLFLKAKSVLKFDIFGSSTT